MSGGRCREPSPRGPQSRGACRGATSLRTRNAAVLPAAQRYIRGVRSRSGTGRGGKIRSTGFDSTTTTGFASFGKRQLFLLENTLFSPFCRRISVLFSFNKSVVSQVFFDKNSTKRPNCLVVRFVGNTMLRLGAKTRKKCENEQKTSFSVKTEKQVISCVLSKRREVLFNK